MIHAARPVLVAAFVVLCFASAARAELIEFRPVGFLTGEQYSYATGVSDYGHVVGAARVGVDQYEAFVWQYLGGGMVGLGGLPGVPVNSHARGISSQGDVIVGVASVPGGSNLFRWTSGGGMIGLGDLPGGNNAGQAYGVSGDGAVVVGYGTNASGAPAVRWTSGGGLVSLGDLPGGAFESNGTAASADGSVIVGYGTDAAGVEAMRWASGTGMVGLGDFAGGADVSAATDVSADGSIVVGFGSTAAGRQMLRWVSGVGLTNLGDLAGGDTNASANAVSGDGTLIGGTDFDGTTSRAVLWNQDDGLFDLQQWLVDQPNFNGSLNGWQLQTVSGISENGRYLVGYGLNPDGNLEAWQVDMQAIPEPSSFVLAGVVAAGALRRRWKAVPQPTPSA